MEFKRRVLKFTLDGESYEARYPRVKDVNNLMNLGDKLDEKKSLDKTLDFLEGLGIPKNVSEEFELPDLKELVKTLVGDGKK